MRFYFNPVCFSVAAPSVRPLSPPSWRSALSICQKHAKSEEKGMEILSANRQLTDLSPSYVTLSDSQNTNILNARTAHLSHTKEKKERGQTEYTPYIKGGPEHTRIQNHPFACGGIITVQACASHQRSILPHPVYFMRFTVRCVPSVKQDCSIKQPERGSWAKRRPSSAYHTTEATSCASSAIAEPIPEGVPSFNVKS